MKGKFNPGEALDQINELLNSKVLPPKKADASNIPAEPSNRPLQNAINKMIPATPPIRM